MRARCTISCRRGSRGPVRPGCGRAAGSRPASADRVSGLRPVEDPRVQAGGDDERSCLYGGPMASVKQFQVTFDCAEPERLARFWCEMLEYVVPSPPEGFATWDAFD